MGTNSSRLPAAVLHGLNASSVAPEQLVTLPAEIVNAFAFAVIGVLCHHILHRANYIKFEDSVCRIPFFLPVFGLGSALRLYDTLEAGLQNVTDLSDHSVLKSLAMGPFIPISTLAYMSLPALGFLIAFQQDHYVLIKHIKPILALSTIGLVASTFMIAAITYMMFGVLAAPGWYTAVDETPWSFFHCVALAIVLALPDCTFFLDMMREQRAPRAVQATLQGEGVIGGAVCYFLFYVFFNLYNSNHMVLSGTCILALLLGSVIFGVVGGVLVQFFLMRTRSSFVLELAVVSAAVYTTFYFAEHFLCGSGLEAVVVLGLWVSAHKDVIVPFTVKPMREFWMFLCIGLASNAFGFAGYSFVDIFIGYFLHGYFAPLVYAVVLYVFGVIFVRCVLVAALNKLLPSSKEQICPGSTPCLLIWTPSFGPLNLFLALFLFDQPLPIEMKQDILLLTCSLVLLSTAINGLSLPFILKAVSKTEKLERRSITATIQHLTEQLERNLEYNKNFSDMDNACWSEVRRLSAPTNLYSVLPQAAEHIQILGSTTLSEANSGEILHALRKGLLETRMQIYGKYYQYGLLSGYTYALLIDQLEQEASSHEKVNDHVTLQPRLWPLTKFQQHMIRFVTYFHYTFAMKPTIAQPDRWWVRLALRIFLSLNTTIVLFAMVVVEGATMVQYARTMWVNTEDSQVLRLNFPLLHSLVFLIFLSIFICKLIVTRKLAMFGDIDVLTDLVAIILFFGDLLVDWVQYGFQEVFARDTLRSLKAILKFSRCLWIFKVIFAWSVSETRRELLFYLMSCYNASQAFIEANQVAAATLRSKLKDGALAKGLAEYLEQSNVVVQRELAWFESVYSDLAAAIKTKILATRNIHNQLYNVRKMVHAGLLQENAADLFIERAALGLKRCYRFTANPEQAHLEQTSFFDDLLDGLEKCPTTTLGDMPLCHDGLAKVISGCVGVQPKNNSCQHGHPVVVLSRGFTRTFPGDSCNQQLLFNLSWNDSDAEVVVVPLSELHLMDHLWQAKYWKRLAVNYLRHNMNFKPLLDTGAHDVDQLLGRSRVVIMEVGQMLHRDSQNLEAIMLLNGSVLDAQRVQFDAEATFCLIPEQSCCLKAVADGAICLVFQNNLRNIPDFGLAAYIETCIDSASCEEDAQSSLDDSSQMPTRMEVRTQEEVEVPKPTYRSLRNKRHIPSILYDLAALNNASSSDHGSTSNRRKCTRPNGGTVSRAFEMNETPEFERRTLM